ncbi:hypothetical protein [Roseovarius Plymouth podovirus 1]|uniref:Uncharacterized protein n=2 Tax=Roseovarius Plymouth podovirus 1 TaxID=926474 RepID=K4Q554_9CAUD|nr:hypothetical protein HYO70_gp13 [Roseovarius Plymouth podovirus 1]CBW47006.1 hypothetical protein [Roseovarius sp. 217 phage 1]CBX87943.1 hypothetical protein [Roseovarius Plymouth podovirus 1]
MKFSHLKSQEEIDREESNRAIKMWAWVIIFSAAFYALLFAALIKYVFFN